MTSDQLTLPLDRPKQPFPSVGTQVRVMKKLVNRRNWPGAPPSNTVKVYDGELLCVVPIGKVPDEKWRTAGWFPLRAGASKYIRVVLRCVSQWDRTKFWVVTITLDKYTLLYPRTETG